MKGNKNYRDILKNLALVSQIGISVVSPMLLAIFLGQLLDNWLSTSGIFVFIFILLGTGAGFLNLLKLTGLLKNKRK